MSAISANVGDRIVLSGSVVTSNNIAIDPTTVNAWTKSPNGQVTTYTYGNSSSLAKVSAGHYQLTFDVDEAGWWFCGFYSAGIGKAASSDITIIVEDSARQ